MRYAWDRNKDAQNRRKHGLSLADGIPALDDPNRYYWFDDRCDYGEERMVTLGRNRMKVLFVVTAILSVEDGRIISVRKANPDEIKQYYLQLGDR